MGMWLKWYAALAALAVFLTVAENGVSWRSWTASDWGTWFGAVGTVATLLMTIRIATESNRIKRDVQTSLALVTTAGFVVKLRNVIRDVGRAGIALQVTYIYPAGLSTIFKESYSKIEATNLWSPEELVPLVFLPNQVAARLAWIGENITLTRALLGKAALREWNVDDEEGASLWMRMLIAELNEASDDAQAVMVECFDFLQDHGFEEAEPGPRNRRRRNGE